MHHSIITRSGRVSYRDTGRGRPILLLHANLHDSHDFDAVIEPLARGHRVIAIDWPGHGHSDSPAEVTAPLLADVLDDIVDSLALEPAVLVGNSVGGYAAARLAITRPDRVAGLVLVNTGGFAPLNPLLRGYFRFMGAPAVTRLLLPRLIRVYMRAQHADDRAIADRTAARAASAHGTAVASALWRSFATPPADLSSRAAELTTPTLLVWGARDVVAPLPYGRAVARRIPHAAFHTLATGHVVFASAPEEFLALVLPFLESLPRRVDAEAASADSSGQSR
ncbi:alpha/beta fold hydrolase [Nocardia yamanashiensis]|uniref:alpha/beta fold hydrolase n=1 Tax=Nocardia yamanashiensis TaxID=209247 RepID=UPI00082E8D52|nr:alpha/beta fold hydrolase [Nocardia yamanashiensis]